MDGLALGPEFAKLLPPLPCIVMTAFDPSASAGGALRLGAADYLEKPFQDIELVAEKVRRAIEHQRADFDRTRFLRRVRGVEAGLDKEEAGGPQQRTQVDMVNEGVEARGGPGNPRLPAAGGRLRQR